MRAACLLPIALSCALALEVGDPFPAVDIFDADGRPVNTRSLKGQYTVIVSGCLT